MYIACLSSHILRFCQDRFLLWRVLQTMFWKKVIAPVFMAILKCSHRQICGHIARVRKQPTQTWQTSKAWYGVISYPTKTRLITWYITPIWWRLSYGYVCHYAYRAYRSSEYLPCITTTCVVKMLLLYLPFYILSKYPLIDIQLRRISRYL